MKYFKCWYTVYATRNMEITFFFNLVVTFSICLDGNLHTSDYQMDF